MATKPNILQRLPYNYIVGGKDTAPIPFDVKLSLDADFKKTVVKSSLIFASGIAFGMGLNALLSYAAKRSK